MGAAKFHERFAIEFGQDEAEKRFVNRFLNAISRRPEEWGWREEPDRYGRGVANRLGVRYQDGQDAVWQIEQMIGGDFLRCLQAIEGLFASVPKPQEFVYQDLRGAVDRFVLQNVKESEVDLGIRWNNGVFIPTGAALLDDATVNEPLRWMRQRGFDSAYKPFERGLSVLLQASKRPELLSVVVTDMYEALEALAKTVTKRPGKELSANAELLLKNLRVSGKYKQVLKDYIDYANDFRHAAASDPKPTLPPHEVESFVYITGTFIRLAIKATDC